MFDNVGEKVKTMASVFCVIGIILSIILGVITIFGGQVLVGFLVIALGAFSSWLSCLSLYAIGEAAENTNKIFYRLENIERKQSNIDQIIKPEPIKTELYQKYKEAVKNQETTKKFEEGSWWCSCGARNSQNSRECSNCYKPKPNK